MFKDADKADKPEAEGAPPAAKNKKKKLIIIGAAAAVTLLGGGGGAYMMFGGAPAKAEAGAEHGEKPEAEAEEGGEEGGEGGHGEKKNEPLDVPPLLVNLRTADGAAHFLKVHVMLVPGPKAAGEELKNSLPELLDAYQPFLRELRPEDLSGSAAVFRIKEELLVRSRDTIGAGKVKEILVQDLIQQ